MPVLKKIIVVICEGKSEMAYLQELNRLFREENIALAFKVVTSNGGNFSRIIAKYREERAKNRKQEIVIWVDKDIYCNGSNDAKKFEDRYHPDFFFNHMNYEDFLVLHLAEKDVLKWQVICNKHNHFTKPMHSAEYCPLINQNNIFGDQAEYTKGSIPFDLSLKRLEQAFGNNECKQISFSSGFLSLLKNEIKTILK